MTDHREPPVVDRDFHRVFLIGIALKGINAVIEIILGFLLLFTHVVTRTVLSLINYALIEDPDNFFATHLHSMALVSPRTQFFGGLYLLAHGLVKVVLAGALLMEKAWAYPASLAILSLFMFYEAVRFAETRSLALLILVLFDAAIIFLIYHEYRRMKLRKS